MQNISFNDSYFEVLDQRMLPNKVEYKQILDVNDGYDAIKHMIVRGAPFIAIVGLFSIAYDIKRNPTKDINHLVNIIISARPTAVNIKIACDKAIVAFHNGENLMEFAKKYYEDDIIKNKKMTDNIMPELHKLFNEKGKLNILTHCNTGCLATAGWGTALGVVRGLLQNDMLKCCYFTETRPWNQGSRLTSTECIMDNIPHTMIADTAVSYIMSNIDCVIVGADRILPNGNVANKIGTNNIAIIAKHYNKPFYVVADSDTFALTNEIVIEDRHNEGFENIPNGLHIVNPGFDLTEKQLITGYVNENKIIVNKSSLSDIQVYGYYNFAHFQSTK
jgi:methylthioribose-1-phosphate isomerase